jgi:hypothetical protein
MDSNEIMHMRKIPGIFALSQDQKQEIYQLNENLIAACGVWLHTGVVYMTLDVLLCSSGSILHPFYSCIDNKQHLTTILPQLNPAKIARLVNIPSSNHSCAIIGELRMLPDLLSRAGFCPSTTGLDNLPRCSLKRCVDSSLLS